MNDQAQNKKFVCKSCGSQSQGTPGTCCGAEREEKKEVITSTRPTARATATANKNMFQKILTRLTPILGAGAVGACPLCWIGSASLLTYVGLGALIPVWRWIAFGFIGLSAIGFILDYQSHRNPYPLVLLALGTAFLYVGRYVFLSTWGAWQIWGPGALLIIGAVVYNKRLFRKPAAPQPQTR